MTITAKAIAPTAATMMATFGTDFFLEAGHLFKGAPHKLFPAPSVKEIYITTISP